VRPFLNDVESIFRDSWQAKTYYGSETKNSDAEIARLEYIARLGWLRCYLLASDLGPLAFQIGYSYDNTYYASDFAFAREWAHLGPGAVLMHLMLQDLFEFDPPEVVDLGAGEAPQKQTFRASPREVVDLCLVPRNRWRFLLAVQRGLSVIEGAVRTALVQTGLANTVRRLLKHKR
jgi:CelD/BcsL family acetyltransferase involved in cellulose biosynthesis